MSVLRANLKLAEGVMQKSRESQKGTARGLSGSDAARALAAFSACCSDACGGPLSAPEVSVFLRNRACIRAS